MRIINGKLYLTISEAVECGMASENYLRKAKSDGTACWDFIDDPTDKRKVLIGYDALNDERKRKVEVRFGNPYDLVARMPILNMVVNDWKANDYFMGYRFTSAAIAKKDAEESSLPPNRVYQYTRAASWLNMINEVQDDKKIVKKQLSLTVPEFFLHVAELITMEKGRGKLQGYAGIDVLPGDFPSSYQRLVAKALNYKTNGYDSLIDPLYGNKNAAKIGRLAGRSEVASCLAMTHVAGDNDLIVSGKGGVLALNTEENDQKTPNKGGAFDQVLAGKQMRVIRAVCEKANNFDSGQVAGLVKVIFEANGWKPLSRARIHDIMNENAHLFAAGTQGKRKYMSKVAMQVKRKATDMPLKYFTLDGWTVELLYQVRGKKGMEYKRLVVVVVLDAMNKYPVGYAIGERETTELIREANRNALIHIKELFGEMYRPWQMQSDNYQIKNLTPFYQAMAHLHTPAAVGNAKAKVIEPYFKDLNKNYCQYLPNWSGFNVTANRENQVNNEYLDKVKSTFPDKAGVIKQIIAIMERERRAKVDEYTSTWPLYEANGGRPEIMNDMDWLMVFGRPLGDRTNKITGQGIVKTINGVEYTYDSFDPAFRANMHIDWTLLGDELNMSRVLAVSPDGKMKFVLAHKRILPMDVRSSTADDHAYRAQITRFNDTRMNEITQLYGDDADVARQVILDTPFELNDDQELAIKAMFITNGQQKERIQDAKGLEAVKRKEQKRIATEEMNSADEWHRERVADLEKKYDFSQFG